MTVAVAAAVAVVVMLLSPTFVPGIAPVGVPMSHAFSFAVSPGACTWGEPVNASYPLASQVAVFWATSNGRNSTFEITEGAGAVLYDQDATGGTFSFVAVNGTYHFQVTCLSWQVNVWGNWTLPTT